MIKIYVDLGLVDIYTESNYVIELENKGNADLYIENIWQSKQNKLQSLTLPITIPQNKSILLEGFLNIVKIGDITSVDMTMDAYYYDINNNKQLETIIVEFIYTTKDNINYYNIFKTLDINYISNILVITLNSDKDIDLILKSLDNENVYVRGKKIKYGNNTYGFIFDSKFIFKKAFDSSSFIILSNSKNVNINNIKYYTL